MNISLDELKKEVGALDNEIGKHFKKYETPQRLLITDGIVNLCEYYNSPIKIMWILKEPYCDKQNGGGGWSIIKDLNEERALGKKCDSQGTWHPIIYSSHGILNNFMNYEKMPKLSDNLALSIVLRQIAFINIQKLPAATRTNNTTLKRSYETNKEILLQQIKTYRPDIIIGGKTLHLFKQDLHITKNDELKYGHFAKDRQLFINTFHPAQTTISRGEYVNKIIERVKDWKEVFS